MKDKSVGIYVPSYHRADSIVTYNLLKHCTYVVRKSEDKAYKDAGIESLIAVEDELIDSFPKVRNWIIDNAKEDIVVQVDDDISAFYYINKNNKKEIDADQIEMEILRVAQLLSDLKLGFASIVMQANVVKYSSEFKFQSTIGLMNWYNKEALKSKYDRNVTLKADIDFELSELMNNRIILIPAYIGANGKYDTNKGGNTEYRNSQKLNATVEYLKTKWGRYYEHNYKKNVSKVKVKR